MSTTKKLSLLLLASVMWLMAGEANALSFNTAGNLPDLNGNGSSDDENKVAEAAVRIWAYAIKSKRSFTLTIQALDLGGNGAGAITDFDALGRPTAGCMKSVMQLAGIVTGIRTLIRSMWS